jgi:hypothetical protein
MQRPGKYNKSIADPSYNAMTLVQFMRECASQLFDNGNEDAAFYFDQIVEHLRSGKGLTSDPRKVSSILGL